MNGLASLFNAIKTKEYNTVRIPLDIWINTETQSLLFQIGPIKNDAVLITCNL